MFLWLLQLPIDTDAESLFVRALVLHLSPTLLLAAVATETLVASCPSPYSTLIPPFASTPFHCLIQNSRLRLAISAFHNTRTPQTRWRDADAEVVERCCCRQSTTFSSSSRPAQRSRYGCLNSWASALREPSESVILSPCFNCAHTDCTLRVSTSS
jgi:hypothetical protein